MCVYITSIFKNVLIPEIVTRLAMCSTFCWAGYNVLCRKQLGDYIQFQDFLILDIELCFMIETVIANP